MTSSASATFLQREGARRRWGDGESRRRRRECPKTFEVTGLTVRMDTDTYANIPTLPHPQHVHVFQRMLLRERHSTWTPLPHHVLPVLIHVLLLLSPPPLPPPTIAPSPPAAPTSLLVLSPPTRGMQEPHLELIREPESEEGVDGKRRSDGGGGRGGRKKRSPGGDKEGERMHFGKQKTDLVGRESKKRKKKVNSNTD